MFHIKICGVRTVDEALTVAECSADAVGLNFFPKSRRFVPLDRAAEIAVALAGRVLRVGLFVNSPPEEVIATFDRLALDLIQLHGDEPPEFIARLDRRPVMRAFRVSRGGVGAVGTYLQKCQALGCPPRMVLLDSHAPGQFGGTGTTGPWDDLADASQAGLLPPFILAGGLAPGNVAEAIRATHPHGVDVASGVENAEGMKAFELVRSFVAAAREALRQSG